MLTPWVVPSFVVASLWQFMWQRDAGIVNKLLVDYLGFVDERPTWLLGENTMWAIIIPSVWRGIPFAMLIFIAGLQAIPPELHEAAAIDGAGPWKRFRHITLPLLRPLIAIQLLFGVIYSAYQFAIPYIMLGSNPGPSADLLMTLIIRQSFSNNLFGYGAAVVDAPDGGHVRLGRDLVPGLPPRPPGGQMSATTRRRWTNWGLNALAYFVLIVMLAPVFWLVASSTQTTSALASGSYDLLHPTFNAFSDMWNAVDFERYLANSIVICSGAALFATAFASSAGYALARFSFRGSRTYELTVVGTQLIPGSLFLLPVFLGFVWLKQNTPIALLDTHLGLILVYTAFFTPLAIYFMRAFFQAIPRELEEAAMVDGCTRFQAFLRVVLPNATPGLVATFVYAFLFAWDELLFATALTEHRAETIPIGIRNFIGNYSEEYDQLMAAGVVSTLPVIIAFFATQRWLVRGLTAGAVKG